MNKRYHSVNNWVIDIQSGAIFHLKTGQSRRLGEYHLKLLEALIQDAGKIFTREELTNLVWDRRIIGNNSLPNAIHVLRVALDDNGKKQKIIKTIPKKGYLIEPSYCCSIEKDDLESAEPDGVLIQPDENGSPSMDEVVVVENTELLMKAHVVDRRMTIAQLVPKSFHWSTVLLLIMLTLLSCAILMGWYIEHENNKRIVIRELQPDTYSNINIYSLELTNEPAGDVNNLYSKLKDTFYEINQQMKMRSVRMKIYLSSTNASLNYTFSITGKCGIQKLTMKIYHWRVDPIRLNNLIKSETRRKLNDMAICYKN